VKTALLILLAAGATAAGARVSVPLPFGEAPMTLQTLVVCFTALVLAPGPALLAMALYVGLGVAGVPVFAGGASGLEVLKGPSGGYLVGFLAAVPMAALFKFVFSGDRLFTQMFFAALFAHVAILGLGAAWLHYGLGRSWYIALDRGVWPFVLGGILKSAVAALAASWVLASKD
jgi:biotin transport system substrate-specific component